MRSQRVFCSILIAGLVLLSGCGSLPEMTQEQENAIVEYAAGLLIKNMKDYDSRLVDLSLYNVVEENPEETEEEPEGMDAVADTEVIDKVEEESYGSIDTLLMPEGVTIAFTESRVADTYPDNGDEDPFFALDATSGNRLLVLQFTVTNTSGEDKEIDIFGMSPKCIVTVNGAKQSVALSTMLLDDLNTYVGTLAAGEAVSLVLLAEMDASVLEQVESIKLKVSTDAGSVTTLLQ